MKSDNFLAKIASSLILVVVFIISFFYLDPDFGWHLRVGQIISQTGVAKNDPLSYTMPSFVFIDHEWLTNLAYYKLFLWLGKIGMAVIVVVTSISTVLLALSSIKKPLFLPLFLLSSAVLLPFVGVRPQIETWFLLSVLVYVTLNNEELWRRWKYFLPFLFVVWVNLHGGFAAGIIYLFIFLSLKFYRQKKIEVSEVLIFGLSIIATFINPFGTGIWKEVFSQIFDTSLRWSIEEWKPSILNFDIPFVVFLVFSLFLTWRYKAKIYLEKLGVYFFFLVQALTSLRHTPLWIIISLPLLAENLNFLDLEVKKYKFGSDRFAKILNFLTIGSLAVFSLESLLVVNSAVNFRENKLYPRDAVQYLKGNLPQGEIFSVYEWGGYLDWKLPEKKVFIDGRMASWRRDTAPISESNYALKEYTRLMQGEVSLNTIAQKYNIELLLVPAAKPKNFAKNLSNYLAKLIGFKNHPNLLEQISQTGWPEIYRDKISIIYQRPEL